MKAEGDRPSRSGGRRASADLERGRAEYERQAWASAYEALSRAGRASTLSGDDLERLALAAYFTGRDDEYVESLKRAYQAHLDATAGARAARAAFWLGLRLLLRGEVGQASGWFGRGRRLLDRERRDCVERGYLLVGSAQAELDAGDLETAYATAATAAGLGERFCDADLVATAQHLMGLIRLREGKIRDGLSLLDEAMVAVAGGELSPLVTGLIYCSVIDGCQQVYALSRAHEWTVALADWCAQQPEMVAFTGICGVHRAELFQLRGHWAQALEEAERSAARGLETHSSTAGAAFYQQGEIRRLRGELEAAEEAYANAHRLGCDPQPGQALLRLAQGRANAAAATIRRSLGAHKDGPRRARLLPAFVEIMLASGRLEEARPATFELATLAERLDSAVLQALADYARGAVELVAGNPAAALEPLQRARAVGQEHQLPYFGARVHALLGACYQALGDEEGHAFETSTARTVLERLGARPDLAWLEALKRQSAADRTGVLTGREREVLRLIAAGKTNKAIAAALSLSEKTVERHVSNIFTKLGVPSRAAATSYAYEHSLL